MHNPSRHAMEFLVRPKMHAGGPSRPWRAHGPRATGSRKNQLGMKVPNTCFTVGRVSAVQTYHFCYQLEPRRPASSPRLRPLPKGRQCFWLNPCRWEQICTFEEDMIAASPLFPFLRVVLYLSDPRRVETAAKLKQEHDALYVSGASSEHFALWNGTTRSIF